MVATADIQLQLDAVQRAASSFACPEQAARALMAADWWLQQPLPPMSLHDVSVWSGPACALESSTIDTYSTSIHA